MYSTSRLVMHKKHRLDTIDYSSVHCLVFVIVDGNDNDNERDKIKVQIYATVLEKKASPEKSTSQI
jgi:hypothetical protein